MRHGDLRRQIETFIERDRRESVIRKRFEVCRRRRKNRRDDRATLTRVSSGPDVFFLDSETREEGELEILSRLLEEPENTSSLHEALRKASESLEEEWGLSEKEEEEERDGVSVLKPTVFWLGDRPHYGFRVRVTTWKRPKSHIGSKTRSRCSSGVRQWMRLGQLRSEAIANGFCA